MKVLAIIGSPQKKGNSYRATREIENQINKIGSVDFEYLFLQDVHLEMCRGCFNCISRGEKYCPLKDDREKIEQMMTNSDGVIFVSPCYCQNVSGLMKNFIDRFAYVFHRPIFFKQQAMILASTAGSGLNETLDYMEIMQVWGFGNMVKLGIINPPWPMRNGLKKKNHSKIEKASLKFYKNLEKKGVSKPTFKQYMHFRFMKFTSSLGEYMPADHEFYKDKEEYFYPLKINPLKKYFVSFFMKIILFIMKDMGPAEK
ncbi:flavodoxin family protein [Methanobacterium alcaliphilum]|uniref:flavodoxin family protein n=1 Tax=Methanobacterium alcaliphilum TaxID=392018 RepID=UPI00200A456D|nr:flavodoxin family protein [Methanobacterium alcaliphilum]MCK9151923.1 flavodoxin family protein [Methanobacterium alcaliphilum]